MPGTHHPETGLTPSQQAFLSVYAECGNITQAANAVGVSRRAHYGWLDNNESYREHFADANETATDKLEKEARRRAIEGVRVYKFTRDGQPILRPGATLDDPDPYYYERVYSDKLIELLLRAHRPEKFRDRVSQEVTGPGGGPLEHSLRQLALLSEEACDQLCDALEDATTDDNTIDNADRNGDTGGLCVDG